MFKERATLKAAPFVWLQQADLIAFVVSLLFVPGALHWYPQTLLYTTYQSQPFEIFKRAESLAFYKLLSPIFRSFSPESLREEFAWRIAASSATKWNFDYREPQWETWLNLDKLGTKA